MSRVIWAWILSISPALTCPAVAQEAPSGGDSAAADQPYQDQLIDPNVEPDPRPGEMMTTDDGLPWVAGASYRLGFREMDGSEQTEHALTGHYQQDTANWGRFQFDMLAKDSDAAGGFVEEGTGGHFTLSQTGFPLAGGWLMDNGLGVQRSVSDPMIESSYRIYLPASIVNGITTSARTDDQEFRFTWGKVGRLEGLFSRTFDSDQATLVGGGYSRDLSEQWRLAAEYWHTERDDGEDTGNLVTALGFDDPDSARSDNLHFLADDDGDTGLWYDGVRRQGRWTHSFGAFSLADDVDWQNANIVNDREGIYYRVDRRTLKSDFNLGVDAARRPSTGDTDYRLFSGARWRLGLDRSIGTQVSLGGLDPGVPEDGTIPPEPVNDWQASVYYNHSFDLFDQRIEAQAGGVEREGDDERTYRVSLDQFWEGSGLGGLSTRLELERQERVMTTTEELLAGLSYRHRFTGGLSVDVGLLGIRRDESGAEAVNGGNASFSIRWPFHDSWTLDLNATYTRSAGSDPVLADRTTTIEGNQVFVSLAWGESGGRLPGVMGRGNAERGIGRITGYVYYDSNRDGRRSPGEDGVEGAVVRLDGVITAITDGQGRYEFWPVAAGSHRLGVSAASLPLPWEPADAMTVDVQPRGENFEDLPVTRISE